VAARTRSAASRVTAGRLLVVVVALVVGFYYAKYYGSYALDRVRQPWAYGAESERLVGRWQGRFTDPGGVEKTILLEIEEPTSDDERAARAGRRPRRRRGRTDVRSFDGTAGIRSRLGAEDYEVYGAVDAETVHAFSAEIRPVDEARRVLPNFTLTRLAPARWQADLLTASFAFVRHDADGASRTSSTSEVVDGRLVEVEDPASAPVVVTLTRVP